jgi:hypothetical protein
LSVTFSGIAAAVICAMACDGIAALPSASITAVEHKLRVIREVTLGIQTPHLHSFARPLLLIARLKMRRVAMACTYPRVTKF